MNTSCVSDNLVMYDIEKFLNKYTRFMTKNVYISKLMYNNFLDSYIYLYERLENDAILYRENLQYKKMIDIRDNKDKLLKLHNRKYFKKSLTSYSVFFEEMKLKNKLELNQKYLVLSNEDKMLYVGNKNIDSLIVTKIKYLIDMEKVKKNKIFVLTDEDNTSLNNILLDNNIDSIDIFNISEYKDIVLCNKNIINSNQKYQILSNYIMNVLFKDKEKFNRLYEVFFNNIYLNKDYIDFDNFSDYHDYIYKRMFLSSKLTIDRFVDREIDKRKKYLRTIRNELMYIKEEVDVANYLCVNGINYKYDNLEKLFYIEEGKKQFKLKVIDNGDNVYNRDNYDENTIYINFNLVSSGVYREILDDEFSIRSICIKEIKKEDIYNILKDSMIDNYFSEFINKYLIKYLDYYDLNKNYDGTRLNNKEVIILKSVYKYYKEYLDSNNLITDNELLKLIETSINNKNYKYVIINGEIELNLNTSVLKIIDDYKEIELIRENIKLLYDYKNYLNDNKYLVMQNTFIDEDEISKLTNLFLKKNLDIINDYLVNNDKKISIYFYDDSNRLLINKNIALKCYEFVRKDSDVLIGLDSISNINNLVYKNYFVKVDRKKLLVNDKKIIDCEEILKIRKSYDKIVLPFLIIDSYHEDLLKKQRDYVIKLMVYTSLNKCRNELILLCPMKKEYEVIKILKNIKNVSVLK